MLSQSTKKTTATNKKRTNQGHNTVTAKKDSLTIARLFTTKGTDPMGKEAGIVFEKRDATISDFKGNIIFEQKDVLVPKFWSQTATNIVVSKYFRGKLGTKEREHSVKDLILRVAKTITDFGNKKGYFATTDDKEAFFDELCYLLVTQRVAFNSPVWFNVGVEEHPQCSACFINSVEDSMDSILSLAKTEGMLFKYGSGTGTNFSSLRAKHESLKGGGEASGPVSFMKGFDAFAGVIKSGGKTRRAAKMVILDVDHPDIYDFITCKDEEEKKAHALINAGYDAGFNVPGGAYDSVMFQNANHSVRVDDDFMQAVLNDDYYFLKNRTDGSNYKKVKAKETFSLMAKSAHACGDPGIQFDTIINKFHTCKNTDRIYASNPCSEYMFLNDSACNLASINLMKFLDDSNCFNVGEFKHTVATTILAQEILVDLASYPTEKIAKNSHDFRPLGLGYANLGSLLMTLGFGYDSDKGRALAFCVTALMGGHAYETSAEIAKAKKPFAKFEENKDSFLDVINLHKKALDSSYADHLDEKVLPIYEESKKTWENALILGKKYGFKNAQTTVLAPTGTIAFMMDCDTTGIEPDIALVKYKTLVGGGNIKIVNQTVKKALQNLGYSQSKQAAIMAYIEKEDTIENAPHLKQEHLPIFDCAFKAQKGSRTLVPMAHVKMMAAVQPFLSGAISKTVNMPNEATIQDIEDIYIKSWQLGLKAVAVYRDGCKQSQPLSSSSSQENKEGNIYPKEGYKPFTFEDLIEAAKNVSDKDLLSKSLGMVQRKRLKPERSAITHKFTIGGHEGYLTVGLFENGQPGEVFCTMAKEGSTISGLMDVFATAISLALQYGVPLSVLVEKFSYTRFDPSGFTKNPNIPMASSVCDYIFRWMELKFLKKDAIDNTLSEEIKFSDEQHHGQSDAPLCITCGNMMTRSGSCYRCANCGSTSGCS